MSSTFQFIHAKLFLCLLVTLFQHHFSFASTNPTGLSLRAVLDDSPGSPLYLIVNLTRAERIEKLINVTNSRVKYNYLDLVSRTNASVVPDNIRIPISRDFLFYVVAFTIGSQRHPVKLLIDTGGGLIWTQCQPCINCFPQDLPIYDPRASIAYGYVPCDHPFCDGDGRVFDCVERKCVYNVQYVGGASTRGVASFDSFQFFIDNANTRNFNNVIFGCSDDSRDVAFQNRDVSGIFGLNMAKNSMASQFFPLIHGRFSYCLVPFTDAIPRSLVLRFGEDIPQLPPQHVHTTLFLPVPGSNYFYLQLLDISVANHRLGFQPYTFQYRGNGGGGCYIDSGSIFTDIDAGTPGNNAYEAVMAVFAAYYGSRGLRRARAGTPRDFDLCYRYRQHYNDFASITYHFNGADYTVDVKSEFYYTEYHMCTLLIVEIKIL